MLTGLVALGVNTVFANTERDAAGKINEQYELAPTRVSCGVLEMDYLRGFAGFRLGLEMSMYCKWMSTTVRFVRVKLEEVQACLW